MTSILTYILIGAVIHFAFHPYTSKQTLEDDEAAVFAVVTTMWPIILTLMIISIVRAVIKEKKNNDL